MSHSVRPTPGWYADPSDSQLLRWWNGTEWSDHTQPMPSRPVLVQEAPQDAISVRNDLATAEPASPPPADLVPSSAEPKPKRRRAWMWAQTWASVNPAMATATHCLRRSRVTSASDSQYWR